MPENLPMIKLEEKAKGLMPNEVLPKSPLLQYASSIIRQSNRRGSKLKNRFSQALETDKEATKYLSEEKD